MPPVRRRAERRGGVSSRGSSPAQNAPTTRTTTATLKKTCARRIAQTGPLDPVGQQREERGRDDDGGQDERHEDERLDDRPAAERNRASAHASGSAATSVSAVETVACQSVNHATSRVDPL